MLPVKVNLDDVVVFTEVVAAGSFSGAARKLGVPPSSVSRRIARLESDLGFTLLHRTTRRVGVTHAGRIYYERTARILYEVEDAARAVVEFQATPSGQLRVTAPPDDGGVIWSMLTGFIRDHPQVEVEVIHTLDYVDLIADNIDVALRGGAPPDSTQLAARRLVDSRFVLVASPRYLERRGVPQRPQDLEGHDCIAMDNWIPNAIKALIGPDGPVRVTFRNRVRTNRQETTRKAALDGFGIAPMVEMTCSKELESGSLVEVLPGAIPFPANFWAVYPLARSQNSATRALVEHLVAVSTGLVGPIADAG